MKIFFKKMSGDLLEIEYKDENISYKDLFFQKYDSYQEDQVSFIRQDDDIDIFEGEIINIFIKPRVSFVIWKENEQFVIHIYDESIEILPSIREIRWREMNEIPQRFQPVKVLKTQFDYWNDEAIISGDRNIVNALSHMTNRKISDYCCEFLL